MQIFIEYGKIKLLQELSVNCIRSKAIWSI